MFAHFVAPVRSSSFGDEDVEGVHRRYGTGATFSLSLSPALSRLGDKISALLCDKLSLRKHSERGRVHGWDKSPSPYKLRATHRTGHPLFANTQV